MSPSGAQLRRYAIHGFARHTHPEVLVEYRCCSHPRSIIKPQTTELPNIPRIFVGRAFRLIAMYRAVHSYLYAVLKSMFLLMPIAIHQTVPSYRYAAPKGC